MPEDQKPEEGVAQQEEPKEPPTPDPLKLPTSAEELEKVINERRADLGRELKATKTRADEAEANLAKITERLEALEAEKLTDAEKAKAAQAKAREELERDRDTWRSTAEEYAAQIAKGKKITMLLAAGVQAQSDALDQLASLIPAEADTDEKVQAEIDLLKARVPGMFASPPPPGPGSSPPGMPPKDGSGSQTSLAAAIKAINDDKTLSPVARQSALTKAYAAHTRGG